MRRASAEKSRASRALPGSSLALPRLERWFQQQVVGPHESARGPGVAAGVILPSRHLSAEERVEIYSGMYFARLLECVREDYPVVVELAGDEAFERLARAYLRRHPSRHYSLNVLGRKLPEFLDGSARVPRRALLADVARVERAISESFDAPASPVLGPAELALVPPSTWPRARVRLSESLRLLELDHRANAVVTAVRQRKPRPPFGRKKTWVAVYRKEWTVWRMDLTRPMHAVLSSLVGGNSLGKALAAGAASFDGSPESLQAEVHRWFREWATEGLFSAVERPGVAR